jgi:hypothetical protein
LFGCFGIFSGSFLQGQNGREVAKRTPQPFYITLASTHTFRAEGQRNEPLGAFRLLSHLPQTFWGEGVRSPSTLLDYLCADPQTFWGKGARSGKMSLLMLLDYLCANSPNILRRGATKWAPWCLLIAFTLTPNYFEVRGSEVHRHFWITFALAPKHSEVRGLEATKWAPRCFWITFAPTRSQCCRRRSPSTGCWWKLSWWRWC